MLLDAEELLGGSESEAIVAKIIAALLSSTRETDLSGWYQHKAVAGTILTEIQTDDLSKTVNAVHSKINTALLASLNLSQLNKIHLSFHLFPEDAQTQAPRALTADLTLYPDLSLQDRSKRLSRRIKRTLDVLFTSLALVLLSPLLAVIATAIKLSSDGPVLFRQERLGRYGIPFTFLKFRSMYSNNDSKIHEEYIKQFISGVADSQVGAGGASSVFKLTGDPRVTRIGKFLRRSSLDELPQLLNVFKGEMSLVGPRPPIPYEFAKYDIWHRRRLLEARPGITGLWQVNGRSKTKFDDMVRLDLQYARAWSLALDLKILLQTPRAVFSGEGAY
ncbi:MAG: sugar transferase [Terriglobia bacterium]